MSEGVPNGVPLLLFFCGARKKLRPYNCRMTLQAELVRDRYARIVLGLPRKYGVHGERLHDLAYALMVLDMEAEVSGRVLHEQHLVQKATELAKGRGWFAKPLFSAYNRAHGQR